MSAPRIRLITRGDDSGSAITANEAIRDAFTRGILRNTSVMVPGPFFREAAEMLGPLSPALCIGLHVTLNAEWDDLRWGPLLGPERVPSQQQRCLAFAHQFKIRPQLASDDIAANAKRGL